MPFGRTRRYFALILFSVLFYAAAPAPAQANSTPSMLVTGLGRGTVAIDGGWQFQTGDNNAWAAPEFDDSNWEQIDIAKPWGVQGHFAYSGFAWYRRHLNFGITAAGYEPNPDQIGIFFPNAKCIYEVYWNGILISRHIHAPGSSTNQYSPARIFRLGPAQDGVLAIRVWTVPLDSQASGNDRGLSLVPRLGNIEAVKNLKIVADNATLRSSLIQFAQILVYAQVAFLGFLIWIRNRDQKLLKWTIFFFLACILNIFSNPQVFPWLYESPVILFSPVHALEDVALWYLLIYLLDLERNTTLMRWTRVLASVSIASAFADNVIFSLDWGSTHVPAFQFLDAIFTFGFSVVELFPLVLIPFALRKRRAPARLLVAVTAFLAEMYDVVQHTATQGQRFTHWTLGDTMLQPVFSASGIAITMPAILSTLLVYAILYAVYRFTVEQGERQTAFQQEFKSAQELQRVLIPENLPALPGYAITSAYRPAAEVGGDFFQLIPLSDSKAGSRSGIYSPGNSGTFSSSSALLVVGDVSGKGLKAAMAVSMIVGALRTLAEISDDPATILAGMNRRIIGRLTDGFVTCLILRINNKGDCAFANAGHLAPFLNGGEVAMEGTLPLGLVPDARYENIKINLGVGDRLTLFTDGLLEARNASGEVYGFERVADLLATRPDANKAIEAAVEFGQEDDITVLTLTRLAIGIESTTLLIAPRLEPANSR
jgi:serine phosphatase RsbU (regulator of sigma subunit)